jgi:hypothetical protein
MNLHPGLNQPDREHLLQRHTGTCSLLLWLVWRSYSEWKARLLAAGQVPGSNFGLATRNSDEVQVQFRFTQTSNETYLIILPPPKKKN